MHRQPLSILKVDILFINEPKLPKTSTDNWYMIPETLQLVPPQYSDCKGRNIYGFTGPNRLIFLASHFLKKNLPGRGTSLYIFCFKHIRRSWISLSAMEMCYGWGPVPDFFVRCFHLALQGYTSFLVETKIKLLPASRVDTWLFRGEVGKEETNVLTATIIFSRVVRA